MTITLYQLPTAFDLPVSVSPYCAKLELYFRLTDREYETAVGNVRKSPNSKVPYVSWPDAAIQADSRDIVERLEAEGPALDDGLEPELAAAGETLERDVEKHLYYACLYARFVDPAGWKHQKPVLEGLLPWLLRPVLVPLIRKTIVKQCADNGFADDSGYPAAIELIERLSAQIGDGPWLLDDAPRVADCMTWATLLQTAYTRTPNPGREAVRERANLRTYIDAVAKHVGFDLPPL